MLNRGSIHWATFVSLFLPCEVYNRRGEAVGVEY